MRPRKLACRAQVSEYPPLMVRNNGQKPTITCRGVFHVPGRARDGSGCLRIAPIGVSQCGVLCLCTVRLFGAVECSVDGHAAMLQLLYSSTVHVHAIECEAQQCVEVVEA